MPPDAALQREWRHFGLAAVAVVAAWLRLPESADRLAGELNLSRSFVGTILMALVTTLPEMAVTLSVLRLGGLDMAIGNLLGSSLFNVMILAIDDLSYRHGPLLAAADPVHAGTAVTALVPRTMSATNLNRPAWLPRSRPARRQRRSGAGSVCITPLTLLTARKTTFLLCKLQSGFRSEQAAAVKIGAQYGPVGRLPCWRTCLACRLA